MCVFHLNIDPMIKDAELAIPLLLPGHMDSSEMRIKSGVDRRKIETNKCSVVVVKGDRFYIASTRYFKYFYTITMMMIVIINIF